MSAISLKSITGITSITTPSGVDNVFTVHTNDTTERFRVDQTGNLNIAGIVTVTKDLDVDGHTNLDNVSVAGITTHYEDVLFSTANGNNILIDKSDNSIKLGNSVTQYFGGTSMWLMHNGSTGYLNNSTGDLYIRDNDGDIYIQAKSGEHSIKCLNDGGVYLYYDGGIVAETTTNGFQITNGALDLNNTGGSGASIRCQSAGVFYAGNAAQGDLALYVQDNTNNSIILQANTGEKYIECNIGSSVDLWYHGGLVARTTERGLRLISNLASSGGISNMLQLDNTGNNNGDGSKITFSRAGTIRTEIEALKNETGNNETDIVFRTTNAGSLGEKVRITAAGAISAGLSIGTDPWGATGNVNTGVRLVNADGGYAISANSKEIVAIFNRTNSGGAIAEYKYNSSVVGSVITDGTNLELNSGASTKISAGGSERLRIASTGQSLFRISGSQTTPINDSNLPVQIAETAQSMCYFGANKGSSYGSLFGHHTAFGGTVIRNILSDDIAFYTNNTSKKMTIRNNGNVEIENGDLKVASGHGIDFSATANSGGSMGSELLDDYEEGTFTPKLRTIGSSQGEQLGTGQYTKIGNIVHLAFAFDNKNATGLQDNNYIQVSNLPFATSGRVCQSTSPMTYNVSGYNNDQVYFITDGNTTLIGFRTVWNSTWQYWASGYFRGGQIYVRACITYQTAA